MPSEQPLAIKRLDDYKNKYKTPDGVDKDLYAYAIEVSLSHWGEGQFKYFDAIISKESMHWKVTGPHYPSGYTKEGIRSSAYGLGGFLDATWENVGCKKTDDPFIQVECTARYIIDRYETPEKAWRFHQGHDWY